MDDREFGSALSDLTGDRVHGAGELARACLQILALSARGAPASGGQGLADQLTRRCDRLMAARPSMAPIINLLSRWRADLKSSTGLPLPILRETTAASAEQLIAEARGAAGAAAALTAEHIGDGKRILTHSLSSTVLEVFQRLKDRGVSALVTESRPLNEGYILARRLAEWGIPVELITDAQIALAAAQADMALVGADTRLHDGDLVNKAGTCLLALAARDNEIPFYVCCESFKCRREPRGTLELEEMEAAELGAPDLPGIRVRNVYFDITPARLISGWIDETGLQR
ncbi:MAG: hypothetical protein GY703_18570 [Gammaproteobacteria bacterium]|nr:hypothetical protein [Gammaproteobacteria bacterium]